MDWFRHYHGCAFDPKWRTVARRARSSIAVVVFTWDTLMEAASANGDDRGSINGWSVDVVADHLMCDAEEIQRVLDELVALGVIEAGGRLRSWDKRQPSDPTAADRMRRYRARMKAARNDPPKGNGEATSDRNDRNADPPNRNVTRRTEQNRTEKSRVGKNAGAGPGVGARATPDESPQLEPSTEPTPYRFQGNIIKLSQTDFERWSASFGALDLAANLEQLDSWLSSPKASPKQRAEWFQLTAGCLCKRHQVALKTPKTADAGPRRQTIAIGKHEERQRRQLAEDRVRAEGLHPLTSEGRARCVQLMQEQAA